MRFLIIIKATPESEAGVMPEEDMLATMASYHEELAKAGNLLDGSGLMPSSAGWRIRYEGSQRTVVDGPFTETKELISGYTLIQARNRDEAKEWTRRFPNPRGKGLSAEIEVRQLYELDDFGPCASINRFKAIGMCD